MVALKKAVLALLQSINLLEKEHDEIRKEVEAIRNLIMTYIGEAKVDEKLHPQTLAAMIKVVEAVQSRANHMGNFNQERLKAMEAMNAVLTDLAIDATATRQ